MLETALQITKANRQIITSNDFMDWIFSKGVKQADEWYKQILPVATLCGYKTMFKDTYVQRRLHQVRIEFNLIECKKLCIYDFPEYNLPPEYEMSETKGILRFNQDTLEFESVFPHPVIIAERYENLQTDEYLSKVLYCDNSPVKFIVVDEFQISNSQSINTLRKKGIRVTSENAKFLVKFLSDFVSVNIHKIPILKSTSVLGWNDGKFLPYSDKLEFDGGDYAKTIFKAVKLAGDYDVWKKEIAKTLKNDFMRVYMATSFASPLLSFTGKLNFITHLWGKTETSKTVALYVALSVWGNPKPISCQWNSTVVAAEQTAILLNNIPMSMNEAELLSNTKSGFHSYQDFIYMFCEGKSKPRGSKDGGLQIGGEWRSSCLSNGEGSLVTADSKEGELNRVLEFLTDEKMFGDDAGAFHILDVIKNNHGHAGAEFTEKCIEYPLSEMWDRLFNEVKPYASGKQSGQMSSLLLGDWLMQVIIWKTDIEKAFENTISFFSRMKRFLKNNTELDIVTRAESYLKGWISQNINNFLGVENANDYHEPNQIYGIVDGDMVYVNNTVFERIMNDKGYNLGKIKKEFKERSIFARVSADTPTVLKKIKGKPVRCYCISYKDDEDTKDLDLI